MGENLIQRKLTNQMEEEILPFTLIPNFVSFDEELRFKFDIEAVQAVFLTENLYRSRRKAFSLLIKHYLTI